MSAGAYARREQSVAMVGGRYSSHDVVLEPQSWLVRVAGATFRPEPKVFELLSYLMQNSGRVVSKAELLDVLWSGDLVGEGVLTRCVSCARKLIVDDLRTPKFIRTIHGRGYEFVAPVVAEPVAGLDVASVPDAACDESGSRQGAPGREREFIGRATEIAALSEALKTPGRERTRMMLVTGEAGAGKTRLLEEATRRAPALVAVHWARASCPEGAPPFFVWQQCFRSIVTERSLRVVLRALRDADGAARGLLLGSGRGQGEQGAGWDSPRARFRDFDAILRGLTELARRRPLVLVFDDLQDADLASLLLLSFVIELSRAPLLILGGLREGKAIREEARDEALTRIRAASLEQALSGLTLDEVRQFIAQSYGSARGTPAQELFARTGGNPSFLSVLVPVRGAPPAPTCPLPSAARHAVRARLAELPAEAVQVLRFAAVVGREFDRAVLERACGLSAASVLDHLRAVSEARLVSKLPSGRYRFDHDLVREVLYDDLDGGELGLAHYKVGSALERISEYQEPRHAAALARHMAQAASHAGASRALDYSIRAGAYALGNFAYEAAVEHFLRARELLPSADVDPATERAVLLDLGLAQVSAGQCEAGRSTLQLAVEKARALRAAEDLAQAALSLAPGLFAIETGVYDRALVNLLEEALEQVGHTNQRLRALLLGRLGLALSWSDPYERRVRICDEARRLADAVGDDGVLAAVTTARAFALLRPSDLDERSELATAALDLSVRAADVQLSMLNRLLRGAALLERGDVTAAAFEADAFGALAEQTRQPQAARIVQAHRASRLLLDGRLDDVERLSSACLAAARRVRDHNALLSFGVHLTLARIEQGSAGQVLADVRDYAAGYPLIVACRVLHAYCLMRAGHAREAVAEYESLGGSGFVLPDDLNWMASMAWLSELCYAFCDAGGAELLYRRLSPYGERLIVIGYAGIACLGSVHRHLGLLAATLGRCELAREHFEAALDVNRRASATLPLARTLRDYGRWLSAMGDDRCRPYLDEAEALAQNRNLADLYATLRTEPPAPRSRLTRKIRTS
jgi:DNA-binding winged helix-turn-helix (wHTH) protein/tetratricopeptide (TPR) repeat protein